MKLDKLGRQLRRDLLGNPKKAAALGLMLMVALYFWAPLVKKWFFPARAKALAANPAGLILEDEPTDSSRETRPATTAFRWDKIRDLMGKDQRMTSAILEKQVLDPFRAAAPPPVEPLAHETQTEQQLTPLPAANVDPASVGLKLTSVVVGPRRSTATINGEAYQAGETIRVGVEGEDQGEIAFVLVRIDRLGAELACGDKTWRLELERAGLARGDEVFRGTRD